MQEEKLNPWLVSLAKKILKLDMDFKNSASLEPVKEKFRKASEAEISGLFKNDCLSNTQAREAMEKARVFAKSLVDSSNSQLG